MHEGFQDLSQYSLYFALPCTFLLTGQNARAADAKKATSIDELAKMYDSTGCKECHEAIYKEWAQSIHSRSIFGTGRTAATIKTTVAVGLAGMEYSGVKKPEDVQVKHLMMCAKCHLPQLAEATDAVAKEIVKNAYIYADPKTTDEARDKAIAQLSKVNINCLICHQRNAITHKWVDGFPGERHRIWIQKRRARGPGPSQDEGKQDHGRVHPLRPVPRTRTEFRARRTVTMRHTLWLSPLLIYT